MGISQEFYMEIRNKCTNVSLWLTLAINEKIKKYTEKESNVIYFLIIFKLRGNTNAAFIVEAKKKLETIIQTNVIVYISDEWFCINM